MSDKLIKSDLAVASENQRRKVIDMINDNIDLLKRVGEEIEQRAKENGGNDMKATLEVMEKHQADLEKLMQ